MLTQNFNNQQDFRGNTQDTLSKLGLMKPRQYNQRQDLRQMIQLVLLQPLTACLHSKGSTEIAALF